LLFYGRTEAMWPLFTVVHCSSSLDSLLLRRITIPIRMVPRYSTGAHKEVNNSFVFFRERHMRHPSPICSRESEKLRLFRFVWACFPCWILRMVLSSSFILGPAPLAFQLSRRFLLLPSWALYFTPVVRSFKVCCTNILYKSKSNAVLFSFLNA
jgi:hypothetical protein